MRFLLATCPVEGDRRQPFLLLSTVQLLDDEPWTPVPCWNGCPSPVTHPLVEVQAAELGAWLPRQIGPESPQDGSDHPDLPAHAPASGSGATSGHSGGIPDDPPDRHRPIGSRTGGAS